MEARLPLVLVIVIVDLKRDSSGTELGMVGRYVRGQGGRLERVF